MSVLVQVLQVVVLCRLLLLIFIWLIAHKRFCIVPCRERSQMIPQLLDRDQTWHLQHKRRTCLYRALVITLYLPSFHSSLAEAELHPFVIACCSWPGCATPSWERFSRNCKALRRTLTESAPVPRVQACPKPASREYLYGFGKLKWD